MEQGFQSSGLAPRTWHTVVGLCNLCHLNEGELNEQALVAAVAVVDVTLVEQSQGLI